VVSVEPLHLDEGTFFELVLQATPCVVFISCHRIHDFNAALPERLETLGVGGVSFGRLAFSELFSQPSLLQFLAREKTRLPSRYPGVLPGYYLFSSGELLAYEAGLPLRADVHQMLPGAALGAALYGVTRRAEPLLKALVAAANRAVSERVAQAFANAVATHSSRHGEASPPRAEPAEAEVIWAYHTLGVTPSSTDAEVNAAWRRLRAEHHPDRAGSDQEEFTRRSGYSRELNHARDVIFAERAGRRRAA
jgi:hypothetical protein